MKRCLLGILLIAVLARAWAALPPLSDEDRYNLATDIILGEVGTVEKKVEKVKLGTDIHYSAQVVVQDVLKGNLKPGAVITLRFDQTGKRPPNWGGPQGQNTPLVEGQRARMFMTAGVHLYRLVEPNGWEKAD